MDSVQNVGLTAGYRPDASIKNIVVYAEKNTDRKM
jgi:hypothetical protein